jgi:signal transduction histidine kinase
MPPSTLEQLLSALESMAFRRTAAGLFEALYPVPLWCEPLVTSTVVPQVFAVGKRSHFLSQFMEEADTFWTSGRDGTLHSGIWTETALSSSHFAAVALARDGEQFLLVNRVDEEHTRQFLILNPARHAVLEHEALAREIEKKEVLVHCIVHDLANPLAGMSGLLDILQTQTLSPGITRMVEMANEAARRQRTLIQQILEVFSAEAAALESLTLTAETAPDLRAVAQSALEQITIACQRHEITTRLVVDPSLGAPCLVAAETTRLERIFANLLENALRHVPPRSEIVIQLRREGELIEAAVMDAGRGVPESALPHLFKKLAPSAGGVRGKAGLGLYFCRITVERWGGSIGYRPSPMGGACFWFRLRPYSASAR